MKKIVIILFLACGLFSYSQYQNDGLDSGRSFVDRISNGQYVKNNLDNGGKELIGSEYLNEEFKIAKVVANDNKSMMIKVRFNTYSQEFEIQQDTKVLALNTDVVKRVEFDGKIFKPINLGSKHIFAQELVDGKLKLFKKYEAVIKEGKIVPGIQTSSPTDKIIINELFLMKKPDQITFFLLKLKKKPILEILNNDKKTVNFVKKNNLSYKKERDVILIFKFYNKIL